MEIVDTSSLSEPSVAAGLAGGCGIDAVDFRHDFPALNQKIHGKPLVYLDNAATTQRPQCVIDEITRFHREDNSNVHRGVHLLSERATQAFEATREKIRHLLSAEHTHEIIFTRGTTESINLVAQSWGHGNVGEGDEVLITEMEHHSNIVPWQMLCERQGARLRVAPITDEGEIDLEAFERMITDRTRLVAVAHVSNALGTINPIKRIAAIAHARGVPVLVDGAQAVPHMAIDVRDIGADFYAMSAHKMYGPMGVGVLYGRTELLDAMPPWMGGGDMIKSVTFEKTVYNDLPHKFEAGTPNVPGVIGLGAAAGYLERVCLRNIAAHELGLLAYATRRLHEIPGLRIIGTSPRKAGVISFVLADVHPHDIGTILDQEGVAIRTGHHCAQPVMKRFGIAATARASLGLYNTTEDIDALIRGLGRVREVFA
ncbi:cysteine desulfurase [Candidatus Sumerlaeota bacterium]|nr:cysteine desulfurase [Candidatus Sumerlaeota bacterium]